jgi:hypothetical protein
MKRYFVPGILAALCLAGSSYIVLESAGYYQKLYVLAGLSSKMGWFTAILSEVFQLALVMLLPTGKENKAKRYSLLVIIALIYIMTIFAAGMNIGKPLIEKWSQSRRQDRLFSILMKEQEVLNQQVNLFNGQKQKVNTAISINAQRKSFQEIKNHLENKDSINEILIQIELAALWLLRILIQLANLICGRFIALKWKENLESMKTNRSESINPNRAKVIRQFKAKYTRNENGFIGILEFDDGSFVSVGPKGKRKYKSFQRALNFFNGSPYKDKIPNDPT